MVFMHVRTYVCTHTHTHTNTHTHTHARTHAQVGRDLVAGDAGGSSGLPWYAYAGGITAVVVIGKVVAGVAAKAIAEVEVC